MRAPSRYFLRGLTDGYVGMFCEVHDCAWQVVLPPNSSVLDVERTMKTHTHPARKAAA